MARKGKEPAGLRRWRLAQKRKHSPRRKARAAPKKVRHMARRRYYGRKRGCGRRKFSAWRMAKGLLYTGAVVAPIYNAYNQLGGGSAGATGAIKAAAFIDPATGSFSLAHGAQIWTPVAVVAVVDFVTTKIPIQQKISKGVNNLIG